MNTSFQKQFYPLAMLIGVVFCLWVAKGLLLPLAFALLLALVLYPLVRWCLRLGMNLFWSTVAVVSGSSIVIGSVLVFFSAKLMSIADQFEQFQGKLREMSQTLFSVINEKVPFANGVSPDSIGKNVFDFLSDSGMFIVSDTLSTTSRFLSHVLLAGLYTFLILLYHKRLTDGVSLFVSEEKRTQFRGMLRSVQKVGQRYLVGMASLILILAILNSVGLLIIGLEYAVFFGALAAVLAIIPYIGTAIGGLIPALYALLTLDNPWSAMAVVITFWVIQTLEGNFLSPKIVGGNLNLNPLAAIVALIAGGSLWGLSGIILALPFAAILKVVCDHYEELKPIAHLMNDGNKEGDRSILSKIKARLKSAKGS